MASGPFDCRPASNNYAVVSPASPGLCSLSDAGPTAADKVTQLTPVRRWPPVTRLMCACTRTRTAECCKAATRR